MMPFHGSLRKSSHESTKVYTCTELFVKLSEQLFSKYIKFNV